MKIKIIAILFASFLSAQGLSDYEILDIEINENLIAAGSKSGVNWKAKDESVWHSIKCKPFGAASGANLDNIILGDNGFAVRLELEKESEISILHSASGKNISIKYNFPNANSQTQLFGYDGFFDEKGYFFAIGDAGVAAFNPNEDTSVIKSDFCVNSIIEYDGITALSPNGKIMRRSNGVWTKIDSLRLQPNEEACKFIKGSDDFPFFILTTDTAAPDNEKLYRKSKENYDLIYKGEGGISKAAITPDDFIYILDNDGSLVVCDIDGKQTPNAQRRRDILLRRFAKTNAPLDYKLTDISIYVGKTGEFFIGFASNKGVFYSKDEISAIKNETPFEYFSKEVEIKHGLKQVYAEPGIINYLHNSCTFEYSLSEDDRVTIDILNYNLDFVCRIVENASRSAAVGSEHSTLRAVDRWDGTANNNGGKSVPPGVYYFKISTKKGHRAVGKVVVAR